MQANLVLFTCPAWRMGPVPILHSPKQIKKHIFKQIRSLISFRRLILEFVFDLWAYLR